MGSLTWLGAVLTAGATSACTGGQCTGGLCTGGQCTTLACMQAPRPRLFLEQSPVIHGT